MNEIAQRTLDEEARQDSKWGQQNHPNGTGPDELVLLGVWLNQDGRPRDSVPLEEMAGSELADAATRTTEQAAQWRRVTWRDIFLEEVFEALAEEDLDKLATELIQCAAVAQQWVRAIQRQKEKA